MASFDYVPWTAIDAVGRDYVPAPPCGFRRLEQRGSDGKVTHYKFVPICARTTRFPEAEDEG